MCPLSLRPDEWSIPVLVFIVAAAMYPSWIAIRAIRLRRIDLYLDPRLNPVGRKALIYGVAMLAIAWVVTGFFVWAFICGRMKA